MHKLLVIIPALNEEDFIAAAIKEIPKKIDNIEKIEIAVINDGSIDKTADRARVGGADHIINLDGHRGLGQAIRAGIAYSVENGFDITVIYDADSQYYGKDIVRVVAPIINNKAQVVIGRRCFEKIKTYPWYMRASQAIGSRLTGLLFKADIQDIASSLRAYSRATAQLLLADLKNDYEEAIESICLMAKNKVKIAWIPVEIRYPTRPSRLITSRLGFARYFFATIIKQYQNH